jgi:hypothetical protein
VTDSWQQYLAPNQDMLADIPDRLEQLMELAGDGDAFLLFLYDELLPVIKHQYKVYSVVVPIIDWFSDLLAAHPDFPCKGEVLDFLGHVFAEHVRDRVGILVEPMRYDYRSGSLTESAPLEAAFFHRFRNLYSTHFGVLRPEVHGRHIALYDAALLDEVNAKYTNYWAICDDPSVIFDASIALGVARYRTQGPPVELSVKGGENLDVSLALCGQPFDRLEVRQLLANAEVGESVWASGSLAVMAADALLISEDDEACKRSVIDLVCEAYMKMVDAPDAEHEFEFPVHKVLMEDVSSILFRPHLGRRRRLSEQDLDSTQRYFYRVLAAELSIHTNTLLYAGLLPLNVSEGQLLEIDDVFESYASD